MSLAISADIVLASDKAYFLLAFTKIGLMPDGGASALVAASIGRTRAMRMALLAERLSATDALAAGLVSAVHSADDLEAEVNAVVDMLRSGPAGRYGNMPGLSKSIYQRHRMEAAGELNAGIRSKLTIVAEVDHVARTLPGAPYTAERL